MEPSRGNQQDPNTQPWAPMGQPVPSPVQQPVPSPVQQPAVPQPGSGQPQHPPLTPEQEAQWQAQWAVNVRKAERDAERYRRAEAHRQWIEAHRERVEWRPIVVFLVIAYALAWLVALPLYLDGGLANPWFGFIAVCMMATPAIAALIVVRFVRRPPSIPRELGLWPLGRAPRFLSSLGLAIVVPILLVLIAVPIGALLGVYPADFVHLSAFQVVIDAQLAALNAPALGIPIWALLAAQLLNVVIGAVINTVPALGEELGWRGYLLPKLLPLGNVRAIILSGVIWGVWHAPLLLLGYNYPYAPGWLGVLMMAGMCILIGAVFGWLRLRSASVWPAALAHGAFNAAAGFSFLFAMAGERVDTVNATILGWSGWIVPLALVVWLVATGTFSAGPPKEAPASVVPIQPWGQPIAQQQPGAHPGAQPGSQTVQQQPVAPPQQNPPQP
ncbi:CPBP family glutamic-type intramembrane protease [Plantibacter sp. YIM 135249]|uniref:CPBP family intramembrane glutamic endopeptidase n=1 Tax=Plantibacter sp. YIM 135249 TaxID=3423918 RepID=UPI003D34D569